MDVLHSSEVQWAAGFWSLEVKVEDGTGDITEHGELRDCKSGVALGGSQTQKGSSPWTESYRIWSHEKNPAWRRQEQRPASRQSQGRRHPGGDKDKYLLEVEIL